MPRYSFGDLCALAGVAFACGAQAESWRAWTLAIVVGILVALIYVGVRFLHNALDRYGKRKAAELRARWSAR